MTKRNDEERWFEDARKRPDRADAADAPPDPGADDYDLEQGTDGARYDGGDFRDFSAEK